MDAKAILEQGAHRPWRTPSRPWVMRQDWNTLLFAHWRIAPERLRTLVPPALPLDVYEGFCWVAVTPFRVTGLRARGLPPVPGTTQFPELNVRTYVILDGKPGVYFFSLDAGAVSAVFGARLLYALPYFYARMRISEAGDRVAYACRRRHMGQIAEFEARYYPTGPVRQAVPETLEHFLVERYCLYAVEGRRLYRAEIHHGPWPLQSAQAEISRNSMAETAGIRLPDDKPLLHFARRLEVLVWAPERVR